MFGKIATALTVASAASAAVITVTVGDGGFVFKPSSITAAVNDTVNFQFTGAPGNHTITQAAFAAPCAPLSGGFDSSFVPVPTGFKGAPAEWNLTISDASKPIWFYCKQTLPSPHCIAGMVGAINAPTSGNTLDSFSAAAKGLSSLPAQGSGSLTGVGASAAASPAPLAGGPAPSGTSAGAPGATTSKSSASSVASGSLWTLLAGVLGIALA